MSSATTKTNSLAKSPRGVGTDMLIVPCAAEKTVEDMFDDPQVAAEEMISTFSHSVVGSYRGFTRAIKFGRTPGPEPFAAPTFGEHSKEILERQ